MKSRFVKGDAKNALGLDSQNQSALRKIPKRSSDYVDAPVIPTNPHGLFDEKANFANGSPNHNDKVNESKGEQSKQEVLPSGAGAGLLDKYPLSSGAISTASVMLISDPGKDTIVWDQNNRTAEELEDTSDIDESIVTNGMNVVPAIARRKNNVIEIIEGSRRRESCIKNHKPLLAIVVSEMSDEDAKVIVVFGNEGRKDTNIFSRVEGYQLLLDGERPICRSKAALARRLGFQREWVSNLMQISEIPPEVKACLSKKERNELPAKKAIKLAKMIVSLKEASRAALVDWATKAADVTVNDIIGRIKGANGTQHGENSKVGTMNIVYRNDTVSVVQNKAMKGILLQLPDSLDVSQLDDDGIVKILSDALDKRTQK
jgi:ParB/RepB/Spo0J family partition protein